MNYIYIFLYILILCICTPMYVFMYWSNRRQIWLAWGCETTKPTWIQKIIRPQKQKNWNTEYELDEKAECYLRKEKSI